VRVDEEGRLCWAKNGNRISTTPDYKDSLNGIVPKDDDSPAYGPNGQLLHDGQSKNLRRKSSMSSMTSDSASEHSDVEGEHYVNEDLGKAKGVSKIKYVSAATILNHLLRGSVKPNSWIFVSSFAGHLPLLAKLSLGCRHIVPLVHWHQAVWCFSAQLISAWSPHIRRRPDQDQGRAAASTLSALRPLPTAYEELPSFCAFAAGQRG
jgi:hypothetical protein